MQSLEFRPRRGAEREVGCEEGLGAVYVEFDFACECIRKLINLFVVRDGT